MLLSDLRNINIFQNCEETLLEKIQKNLKIKEEKSGTTILNQGDETKNLYIIIDGTLLITQLAEDGKVVSLELLKKGQCFGEIAIIDGAPRSASVTSLGDVKLGSLSESFVKETLMNDLNFTKSLLLRFSRIVRNANIQIFSLITANARKRLLYQLLRLSKMNKENPRLRVVEKGLSHTAIGSFAGISRETVTRLISDLKSDQILSSNASGELILNVEDISAELSSIIGSN
tara:strand:- start:41 stop:733 length:693 start_codon:yes stop_codon:yes gene_type:complete